jgi:NitT/TauT family transport system ATP-binding protein/nitrate/nitrite transport system substrate-binding protein
LCAALKQACVWLESIPNRFEAARLLSQDKYLDAKLDVIAPSLLGSCLTHIGKPPRSIPSYNQFSVSQNSSINQPEHIRGEWLLKQMSKAGQLQDVEIPAGFINTVFRPDIYQKMRLLLEDQSVQFYRNSG